MKNITLTVLGFILFLTAHSQSINEARKLTENEQYEAASAMYQALIAKNSSDIVAFYYYGDNLLRSENTDSATIIFDKAATINPAHPLIKVGKAKVLLSSINIREAKAGSESDPSNAESRQRYQQAQENQNKAFALIDEATANSTDNEVLVEAADALINFKTRDLDKAKTFLDKVIAADSKNILAHLLYGDIYTQLNNGTLAADYYNRALDMNKASARAILSKGRLYKQSTNYEGAAREFENAIAIEPNYAPAHRELGDAYSRLGKRKEAKEEYRKYLEISKNNCPARITYAFFLYGSKNYSESISELNQVKQRCDSNNLRLLRVQTFVYYDSGLYDTALVSAKRLFTLVPPEKRTGSDLEYYGKILIKTSPDSSGILEAIEYIQKSIALDPNRSDLLSVLAEAYMKLKQYANAAQVLKQKITLGRDVKVLDHYNLGSAYYYSKQFIEGDSAAKRVNELSPTWGPGWTLRARINSSIDSTSELGLAKPFYEKYVELATADSTSVGKYQAGLIEAYGYLAYYYILKNDKQNGLLYLKKKYEMPLEPEEKKKVKDAIDQLEGRGPKPKKP